MWCDPWELYIQEILWDMLRSSWDLVKLQPCPCGMEVVSQGSSPRRPGPLIQCEWDTVVNKRLGPWTDDVNVLCWPEAYPAQGQELGAIWLLQTESSNTDRVWLRNFSAGVCLTVEPFFGFFWSLLSFVNVSAEYWLWEISNSVHVRAWHSLTCPQTKVEKGDFEDEVLKSTLLGSSVTC